MTVPTWFAVDAVSLLILALILIASIQSHVAYSKRQRIFMAMAVYVVLIVLAHVVMAVGMEHGNHAAAVFGLTVNYGFNPGTMVFWIQYAGTFVEEGIQGDEKKAINCRWLAVLHVVILSNIVFALVNLWTGWFFVYTPAGAYLRGPLFVPRFVLQAATIMLAEMYLFRYRRQIGPHTFPWLVAIPVAPILGAVLQAFVAGMVPLELAGYTLSIAQIHLFIQDRTTSTDALTGLGNRRMLDYAFDLYGHRAEAGRRFSAIMLDIDRFKEINDVYGHAEGDRALVAVSGVLQRTFRAQDVIARMGGDEFYVITDIDDRDTLAKVVGRLRHNLDEFNAEGSLPFAVEVSIGFDVFDGDRYHDIDEFRSRLDTMIYEEKAGKGALRA